jgi:AraC family transcriptional regulator, regulatory protein of adaptative response / methylphosphotriester-DNA alkyltransferase methyltransferase
MEKKDFEGMLYIHPIHLSNTIKEVTGQYTCNLYENRLLDVSKEVSEKGDYGQHLCTRPYRK